ncbi:hypothetical protein ACFWN5_03575 [Streptomyces sp. NPDC058430]|uniref:hypothetical protein n=1 Tax=unclassified Streptomyces TaxID=2593676 RepID=UPI00364305CB
MADLDRYRVTLTTGGAVVMQGAWSNLETSERKFRSWIGSYGSMPGARITLTDRLDGKAEQVLQSWPDA